VCISHFSSFSEFLAIFNVQQYVFLISIIFSFQPYSSSYRVFVSLCSVVTVLAIFHLPTVCVSFSPFFYFLTIYRSYSVHNSFFTFFTVSCHVPGPTNVSFAVFSLVTFLTIFKVLSVCVSFSTFFSFLTIFHVKQCLCLIFHIVQVSRHIHILEFVCLIFLVFQFSRHIPGPTVCISHFSIFFQCFLPYFTSSSFFFSFP